MFWLLVVVGAVVVCGAFVLLAGADAARLARRLRFLFALAMIGAAAMLSRSFLWFLAAPLLRFGMLRWQELRGAGQGRGAPGPSSAGPMTREEACHILGISLNSAPEQIRRAHRRLIRSVHPDRGGSDWLASKLNEARDVLLKGR